MKKSLVTGVILQCLLWIIGLLRNNLELVETLSFYLLGICVLFAAMISFSAMLPDTQAAYYANHAKERSSNKSRMRWMVHLLCVALPSLAVYLLMANDLL
ncbi:hypothetical protein [Brevibacillus brevis]|uniref:DUF5316 domain-containing protein n=1 Tax=Brevibacillus brevis TaxID=1393 RepID=A0ABY9T402_BREBE|nr:hypothetical protein [Brevibacillus brevis]WNC13153.1 hypothetical protein RGB73_20865 [Brevibacillus brevis]